jgi:hypothetical protein
MKISLICKVNNNRLSTSSTDEIRKFISSMNGNDIEITLQKKRVKRSDKQNAYYWGCIIPIVCNALKELGHRLSNEECHEWLKMKFNHECAINTKTGEIIGDIPKSTKTLTKAEFIEYTEKICQWCAEYLDIVIPEPNEQTQLTIN